MPLLQWREGLPWAECAVRLVHTADCRVPGAHGEDARREEWRLQKRKAKHPPGSAGRPGPGGCRERPATQGVLPRGVLLLLHVTGKTDHVEL